MYYAYSGMKLGDQDKSWDLHKVCCFCVEKLRQWTQHKKKSFSFVIPMIWREPGNHSDDYFFFAPVMCKDVTAKIKRMDICYPNMPSAMRPVAHGPDIPIPASPETLDTSPPDSEYDVSDCDDVDFQPTSSEPQLFYTK
jgi:hypothetical protein